ncbi:MAG: IS4 family transposase [Rhizobium sp.]|nr:IS4 family transposase [Rhizobium leguminosarum]NDK54240.1 IS4 family transposase [Rhizobium laguerreae]MBY5365454.1 IS4 family transposase [Rhizobium leguminosarum]UWM73958.1 IS4 family transposase [Rhizobium leguminosarum bv. viciae]UWM76377.1 IS4 family transposase [Rhizobium leguminosarum bv. viciae]UWM77409.1 IS4 family transposase [Rhizobium leguminosarum bv. viciae]
MLLRRIVLRETVCLRQLAEGNHSQEIRFGRFLNNSAVSVEEIIAGWSQETRSAVEGRHVLALQDTSEIKFATTPDSRRELGKIKKGNCFGLLLHPMLALDADTGSCLGLVGGRVWTRGSEELTPHAERPLNEKESRRWVETAEAAKLVLSRAARVTAIADREGDFFIMWARLPDRRFDLLSRVMHDHALIDGSKLRRAVETVAFCDTQTIDLRERADRPARQATVCLRFGEATIRRPQNLREAGLPDGVRLSWVEIVEPAAPDGVEPLHWLLLTTHWLSSPADAWQIVAWYKQRWMIEQFFRVMKNQGFKIEDSQLHLAARLEKLVAIAAKAAAIVLQLVQARSGGDHQPASLTFTAAEIDTLAALESRFKGTTKLQSNPHSKASLAWAAWIIAKLGGWNGYASAKPPGPITFFNGLKYFRAVADGWALRDMYMP